MSSRPDADANRGAPVIAACHRQLVLAISGIGDDALVYDAAHRLARRVSDATSGGIAMRIERAASSGLEAFRSGMADLYLGGEHQHIGAHPAFACFSGLPLGHDLEPLHVSAWIAVGGGRDLWNELAAPFGLKPLALAPLGSAGGLASDRWIEHTRDLAGRRIGVAGLAQSVVRFIGAEPVTIDDTEIAAAAAGSCFVAAEPVCPPIAPLGHWSFRPGLNPSGLAVSIGAQRRLWLALDAQDRAVLESCAAIEAQRITAEAVARGLLARRIAADRGYPQPIALPERVRRDLEDASDTVVADAAAQDAFARRVFDSHAAFRRLAFEHRTVLLA